MGCCCNGGWSIIEEDLIYILTYYYYWNKDSVLFFVGVAGRMFSRQEKKFVGLKLDSFVGQMSDLMMMSGNIIIMRFTFPSIV